MWTCQKLLLLTLCSFHIAPSQNTVQELRTAYSTAGVFNGRYWNGAPKDSKNMLILGIAYGIHLGRQTLSGEPCGKCALALTVFEPAAFSPQDVIDSMDRLFRDAANLNMSITDAYFLTTARMSSGDKDAIEKEILRRRSNANKFHSKSLSSKIAVL